MNVVALMGRLVADPELRHTPSNVAVCRFTIAVDRSYNKPGAERQADFITIVAWRGTAEFVCKYFTKGQMVAVTGEIQTGSYTDNNGAKRYTFEVVASNVNFTESRKSGNTQTAGDSYQNSTPAPYNEPAQTFSSGSREDFFEVAGDDDLPF